MIIKYIANDGTEFSSMEECKIYERDMKGIDKIIIWTRNENKSLIDLNNLSRDNLPVYDMLEKRVIDFPEDFREAIHRGLAVYIPTKETLIRAKNSCYGVIITDGLKVGLNFWNDERLCWVDADYYRETFCNLLRDFNIFVEEMESNI